MPPVTIEHPPMSQGFATVDLSESGYESESWSAAEFADYNRKAATEHAIPLQGRNSNAHRRQDRPEDEYEDEYDPYMDDVGHSSANKSLLGGLKITAKAQAKNYLRKPWFLMCGLGLILGLIVLSSLGSSRLSMPINEDKTKGPSYLPITLDHIFNQTFRPQRTSYNWVAGVDGSYAVRQGSKVIIKHVELANETTIVSSPKDTNNNAIAFSGFFISNDLEYVLLETDYEPGWRHSFYANYWLWNVAGNKAVPLTPKPSDKYVPDEIGSGKVALVQWSPVNNHVAWVRDNDLFVTLDGREEVRITTDGSKELINGIADWVYEEEVLGSHTALWFSPAGTHVAYLKFNESLVPQYDLQYYQKEGLASNSYPERIRVKYPKPGFPNPTVTLHVATPGSPDPDGIDVPVQFEAENYFHADDRLIVEVTWVSDASLLVRMTNRVQDSQRLFLVKSIESVNATGPAKWTGTMVRKRAETDGGWTTKLQPLSFIPPSAAVGRDDPQYVELMENEDGFMHLAHFDAVDAKEPRAWLTSGNWEVEKVLGVDNEHGRVYFLSTEDGPTQRHVYSVRLNKEKLRLTPPADATAFSSAYPSWNFPTEDMSADTVISGAGAAATGYYSASFSPQCGYYVLDYAGPDVPWSRVGRTDSEWRGPEQDNKRLRDLIPAYAMPRRSFIQLPAADTKPVAEADTAGDAASAPGAGARAPIPPPVLMNAMLQVPHDFNRNGTTKYPVLMRVYGGPMSQLVDQRFSVDFMSALVSAGGFITLTVDGRGTGLMGRHFRNAVASHLGSVEVDDQLAAARWLAAQPFVDPKRIAIWGWSYGGYMTSKVIEANSGLIALGMAVAPVTDWMFYDSIYTERYMKTPRNNAKGYDKSAVRDMTGFKNAKFLLVHGTGDDNVHFQNTASLVWRLTGAQVSSHSYRVQIYTDSDHSIYANGASMAIYNLLWNFVNDAFWGPAAHSGSSGVGAIPVVGPS
ncbi:dipeptidyl peptidase IV N-terminal region-domain-containing protein [Geranomyces variabilis]|nr:dipeptidyl peptidase IV N-terminal region-domain-containing protein [Geranomyces variabilis]KAJ3142760.1 hypothetical protein HDU90_002631 [Geranomyces variabilis]